MSALRVSMRAGERIFVNGAVIRVDRKTSIEFLNEVDFLLEQHVLQEDEATTPLRQLYFVLQAMLIAPGRAAETLPAFRILLTNILSTTRDARIVEDLKAVDRQVGEGAIFDALRAIRALYRREIAPLPALPPANGLPGRDKSHGAPE